LEIGECACYDGHREDDGKDERGVDLQLHKSRSRYELIGHEILMNF
jgi:hypothetical protein